MSDANLDLAQKLIDLTLAAGADAADTIVSDSASLSLSCRMGELEDCERAESRDVGLRAMIGQKQAFVSGSAVDDAALKQLAERAVAMAEATPEDRYCGFAPKERLATDLPDLDIADAHEPSADELLAMAKDCEDAARGVDGITNSEGGSARHGIANILIATSNGFSADYKRSSNGVSAMVIAEQNGNMERDYDYSAAVFAADMDSPDKVGNSAATRTLARLGAIKPPTGQFPVVYDKRVSASIVGTMAGAINGAAIARGTSFLKDRMGEQVAASGLTFVDDPLRPRGMGSRLFDGEGLAVKRREMIKDGVLQGWFLDIASATKLGLSSTGNASRSLGGPPSPSTSNFYLENGDISFDELLADIDAGFLVTEMMGSSVDMITGDYSRGAAGFWIEKGKIAHPVAEATIAGNLKDMFMAITRANDIDMRKSTAAPSLRVDGMTVAGS